MFEIIAGLAGAEAARERADAAAEPAHSSLGNLAQKRLEFAERHLDRIEVRRVLRQIAKLRAASLDRFAHASNLVRRQIVHDNDVFALKRRSQTLLDIGKERRSSHGAVNDKWRRHPVAA